MKIKISYSKNSKDKRGEKVRMQKMKNSKFVEIFERYQKLVMKVVYDKSSDTELAKEICQHTFLRKR